MPKVSISINTYNRPDLVNEAIQSVRQQTFKDLEIIVVDDFSVPVYEVIGADIVLRHTCNQGPAAAHNTAFSHAAGEYFVYLDDDDLMTPQNYLELCVQLLDDRSDIDIATPKGTSLLNEEILKHNYVPSISMHRRWLWDRHRYENPSNLAYGLIDWTFWCRCYQAGAKSLSISVPKGVKWRREHSRITHNYGATEVFERMRSDMYKLLEE